MKQTGRRYLVVGYGDLVDLFEGGNGVGVVAQVLLAAHQQERCVGAEVSYLGHPLQQSLLFIR